MPTNTAVGQFGTNGIGQTVLQYGAVTLQRCLIRFYDQQPVLDTGQVSLKYWRTIVHVTGYMIGTPPPGSFMSGDGQGSAAVGFVQARWQLVPRQLFQLATGCVGSTAATGTMLLFACPMQYRIPAAPDTTTTFDLKDPITNQTLTVNGNPLTVKGIALQDVNDGPYCRDFRIVHVSSDNVFKVEAEFEVSRIQCDAADSGLTSRAGNTTGMLANRWSHLDSIDVNLRTHRIYHGILELASSTFNPHWFRQMVVPPLQPGFRRERIDFAAAENGKVLQYTISDVSVATAAPYPATMWNVTQTNSSLMGDVMKCTSQVNVSLTAPEDVDKGQLIQLALYILTAKIQGSVPGQPPKAGPKQIYWNDISFTDYTGDLNRIDASASAWCAVQELKDQVNGIGGQGLLVNLTGIGEILTFAGADGSGGIPQFAGGPIYDNLLSNGAYPDQEPIYQGPRALISAFYNYLQVPCDNEHLINTGRNQDSKDMNPSIADLVTPPNLNNPQVPATAIIVPDIKDIISTPPEFSNSHLPASSTNPNGAMYSHWQMQSTYPTKAMRAAMPIALGAYSGSGPDTRSTTLMVTLAPYQAMRVVRIRAERIGNWPEFPDPDKMDYDYYLGASVASAPTNIGSSTPTYQYNPPVTQTFLRKKLLGHTEQKSVSGGQPLFTAEWEAIFALSRAPFADEAMKIGWNSWEAASMTQTNAVLTSSVYNPGNSVYPQ